MMGVAEGAEVVRWLLEWDSRRRSQDPLELGKIEKLAEEN
jgi:hypothetical protein